MKKLALSILSLSLVASAHAQTGAGHYLLSGLVNYNSSKTDNSSYPNGQIYKSSSFQFIPTVGYFVADNLVIGLSGSITNNKQEQADNGINQNLNLSQYTAKTLGPFVRYYKMVNEKFGFYGQLEGSYVTTANKSSYETTSGQNNITRKARGGSAAIIPGIVFFPIEKIGLQMGIGSIGYSGITERPTSPTPVPNNLRSKSSGFSTNFGLAYLSLGASLHLGGN